MTVSEILEKIERDRAFYGKTGGVTLSGGEPFSQGEATVTLLRTCKKYGISTAVETCGYVDPSLLKKALPYVDLFLWDVKDTDEARHKEYTGVSNKPILDCLKFANDLGARIRLRCILVNGINNDRGHYENIARIALSLQNFDGVEIIPYHAYGGTKSEFLGLENSGRTEWIPTQEQIEEAKNILRKSAVTVY